MFVGIPAPAKTRDSAGGHTCPGSVLLCEVLSDHIGLHGRQRHLLHSLASLDKVIPQTMRGGPTASRPSNSMSTAPPRKKACSQCSQAKARCGLEKPFCSRCQTRRLLCQYDTAIEAQPNGKSGGGAALQSETSTGSTSVDVTDVTARLNPRPIVFDGSALAESCAFSSVADSGVGVSPGPFDTGFIPVGTHQTRRRCPEAHLTLNDLEFTDLDLVCTVDSNRIRSRWLESFLPTHSQKPKLLLPGTLHFLSGVFRTYPQILLKTSSPHPLIHASQLTGPKIATPLANCLMLTRMWEGQVQGGEAIMQETIQREMRRLFEEVGTK
jgi:Fungal Zn(2)-Cys(6) binuclear cluster domain